MNRLSKNIFKFFIAKLITDYQCPKSVSRVGGDSDSQNCYYVYVYLKSKPILVIKELYEKGVVGNFYNNDEFQGESCIPFEWLKLSDIRITHYFGIGEFSYRGLFEYILFGFTKKDIVHFYIEKIVYKASQFFFNRTKLVMLQRYKLLKILVRNHIESTHSGTDHLVLMDKIFTEKWILHPSGEDAEKKLMLYLDSFVETGELSKVNDEYVVNGKAIATIDNYETNERRHQDNIKTQRRMIYLTIVIAIFALVQAGVIKLPIIVDLSKLF